MSFDVRHSLILMDVHQVSAKKRKLKKFTAGTEARRRAREVAGPPPAERIILDKRRKPSKHKKNFLEDGGR